MDAFWTLDSSYLLRAACASWLLFIGNLVYWSLSRPFQHYLDFSMCDPGIWRQWWVCFCLTWPCAFGCLACWPGQDQALWGTGVRAVRPASPYLKGEKSLLCCDRCRLTDSFSVFCLACWECIAWMSELPGELEFFPACFCRLPHSSCTVQGAPHILSWCQLPVSVDFWHDSKHPRNRLRGLKVMEIALACGAVTHHNGNMAVLKTATWQPPERQANKLPPPKKTQTQEESGSHRPPQGCVFYWVFLNVLPSSRH